LSRAARRANQPPAVPVFHLVRLSEVGMPTPMRAAADHDFNDPRPCPAVFFVSRRTDQPAAMGTSTSPASPSRRLTTVKDVGTKWPLSDPKLATAASHSPGDSRSTRARAEMHLPGEVGSDQEPLALPVKSTTPTAMRSMERTTRTKSAPPTGSGRTGPSQSTDTAPFCRPGSCGGDGLVKQPGDRLDAGGDLVGLVDEQPRQWLRATGRSPSPRRYEVARFQ
jgi:hypothetical protein